MFEEQAHTPSVFQQFLHRKSLITKRLYIIPAVVGDDQNNRHRF